VLLILRQLAGLRLLPLPRKLPPLNVHTGGQICGEIYLTEANGSRGSDSRRLALGT